MRVILLIASYIACLGLGLLVGFAWGIISEQYYLLKKVKEQNNLVIIQGHMYRVISERDRIKSLLADE